MGDLGDLSGFLKGGGVSDLSWLDVNEKEYRSLDQLPKQNLDISPDLQALWAHEDKPASAYLLPNKDLPKTMGDLSQAHGKLASAIKTAARVQLYISSDMDAWKRAMVGRFGMQALREHKASLKEVLEERGLLGRIYVNASDFPSCHTGEKRTTQLARKVASDAEFVVAKPKCDGCIHATTLSTGGQTCAVFHKKLVLEVPYTETLADKVESAQSARGKAVQASTDDPKERIRLAMLASEEAPHVPAAYRPVENTTRLLPKVTTGKVHLPMVASQQAQLANDALAADQLLLAGKITKEAAAEAHQKVATQKKGLEVLSVLKREMLRGRTPRDVLSSLKVSFSMDELKSTRSVWERTFKEAGLYGSVYTTQASFDDCHEGADFLAKHNPSIKGVVAGEKCEGCLFNKMSRCMLYGKRLVKQASDLYTPETVREVIREHRLAGRLETGADTIAWGETPEGSLREIYRVASTPAPSTSTRMVERAHTAMAAPSSTSGLTKREILRTASRYLNEGLYGDQLLTLLKKQFDIRDLRASKEELRSVLAEQGLQGIYYVDPTIYADYGKGCNEAERLHRSRLVPYVKMASACVSCVHQAQAGHCSKLNKPLVDEVPYLDKAAQQREILASGKSTEVPYAQLMKTG